jgi:hypothetical protein
MSHLALQQQALLNALFLDSADNAIKNIAAYAIDTGARGLKAYISNGHALAVRALPAAYPVVARLLGDDSMADVSRALWHAHPPACGDAALWGDALPEFIERSTQLADEPYLADVARAEWALHCCATAADDPLDERPDLDSFALLSSYDPAELTLRLAPGVAALHSVWPVADIIAAHQALDDGRVQYHECPPTLAQTGQKIRERIAQDTVVWRAQLVPRLRLAHAGEGLLLGAMLAGKSLGDALDASPTLDFGSWFPVAVQTGLVTGALLRSADVSTHPPA